MSFRVDAGVNYIPQSGTLNFYAAFYPNEC
jgi:hypothetical protein